MGFDIVCAASVFLFICTPWYVFALVHFVDAFASSPAQRGSHRPYELAARQPQVILESGG